MKILLVEDEEIIAVTLGDDLREAGHDVIHTADGKEALAILRDQVFDCVITDVRLPGADGIEVLQAAKAMDVLGNREARVYVSAVKAMVPEKVCTIIDQAIQLHGATGLSHWTPLARLYADIRHLRFADGPDEVHHMVVGRHELQQYDLW